MHVHLILNYVLTRKCYAPAISESTDQVPAHAICRMANRPTPPPPGTLILRHEQDAPRERSACGHRYRLISKGDQNVAAWAHTVDIDGARPHYHKRTTELYYVLEGKGSVILDGEKHPVHPGTMIHIPPGVLHGAVGKMRVLVVGIPDIDDSDVFYPDS